MFTNTFDKVVLTQLQLRRLYNLQGLSWFDNPNSGNDIINILKGSILETNTYTTQEYKEWGKQWAARYPIVIAYSNIRYSSDTSSDTGDWEYSWQKYSVLSSNFNISDEFNINNKSYNFNDYYQNTEVLGIVPNPVITDFSIDRRTANNTLRNISFKITCFSHQQFLNVRDYYCVPATSIFFQYGYATKHSINTLFSPILDKNEINNKADNTKHNYLNYKNSKKESIERSKGLLQYCTGIVYNYEIQQLNTKFIITIKLMTQGSSEILTLIRNSSEIQKDKTSGMSNIIRDIASLPIFDNQVITLKQDKKNVKYVTLNWVGNIVLQMIRARGNLFLAAAEGGTKDLYTSVIPGNPLLKYNIPTYCPVGLCSKDPNIFIYDPDIPNCPNYVKQFFIQDVDTLSYQEIFKTQADIYSNFENLKMIYDKIGIGLSTNVNEDTVRYNHNNWYQFYDHGIDEITTVTVPLPREDKEYPKTKQTKLVFLGNIYINLDVITSYIDDFAQLKMTSFLDHIFAKIDAAFSSQINLEYYSDDVGSTIQVAQKQYIYKSKLGFYKIPNFGNESIIKQLSIKAKVPDNARLLTVGQYNQRTYSDEYEQGLSIMFQSIFGDKKRLIDINLPSLSERHSLQDANKQYSKDLGVTQKQTQESKTKRTDQKQISYKQAISKIWNVDGTSINTAYLNTNNVQAAINKNNASVSAAEKKAIKNQLNLFLYDYSVYSINIQITVDFIAGLSAGQMFKLQFNPLGWQSCFTVLASEHIINDKGATTKIIGMLLGVES